MEWQIVVALLIAIPIILFPVVFVWYMNAGGLYAAIKERRFKVAQAVLRKIRTGLTIAVPIGIYVFALWFSFGHFGWEVTLAIGLALPIVLLVPALVWAGVASGLFLVIRETIRRRVSAPRRKPARMAVEPVTREII